MPRATGSQSGKGKPDSGESSKGKDKSSKSKSSKDKSSKEKSSKGKSSKDKSSKDRSSKCNPKGEKGEPSQQEFISLYCAIYVPHFGNYDHWAFAAFHHTTENWLVFEVVQDMEDGPFRPVMREVNPANSTRCRLPLHELCVMDARWMFSLMGWIQAIQVPGDGDSWNCQDYVFDIWETVHMNGAIDDETWQTGYNSMFPHYGPDVGGQEGEDEGYEEHEHGGNGEGEQGRYYPSEEFVYDSGSN